VVRYYDHYNAPCILSDKKKKKKKVTVFSIILIASFKLKVTSFDTCSNNNDNINLENKT